jgi:PadR family transcriptional regulator AphA
MSLDHILLGMLERPAAGYDLGREFESSARLFWSAELSQIYPTLKRLEKRGYLSSREVPSERGPNRRVYERTPAGTEALAAWLREDPKLGHARLPHIAQFYFLGELGDVDETRRFLHALKRSLEERLAAYRAIEETMRRECPSLESVPHAQYHRYASLRAGVLVAEARLEWCDQTLDDLAVREAAMTHDTGVA